MSRRLAAKFNNNGITSLSSDKPVVFRIFARNGRNIYTGAAKRGEIDDVLKDYLPGGKKPILDGAKIEIIQMNSYKEAEKNSYRIIKWERPKYNTSNASFRLIRTNASKIKGTIDKDLSETNSYKFSLKTKEK